MRYIKGDLIKLFKEGQFDSIAHQCNAYGIGAGIAGKLVKEFPALQDIYRFNEPASLPGSYIIYNCDYGKIFNLFSQYKPGSCTPKGLDSFQSRMGYLCECLTQMEKNELPQRLGIPLIASGIAADSALKGTLSDLEYFRNHVARLFEIILVNWDITVVVYE